MRKRNLGKRIAVFLLALVMASSTAFAAVGDVKPVDTGLTGNIDTSDTISLPLRIMDYEADGMLFEFAESNAYDSNDADSDGRTGHDSKIAADFGAKYAYDFTTLTSTTTKEGCESLTSVSITDYWSDVKIEVKTGTYANYAKLSHVENSGNDWRNGNAAVLLTDFKAEVSMNDIRYVVLVYRTNVEDALHLCINNSANGGAGNTGHQAKFTMTKKGDVDDGSTANWTYAIYDLKTGGITDWTTTTGIYAALPMDASGDYIDIAHVAYFGDEKQAEAFGEYALTDGSDRGDNRGFGLLRSSRTQSNGTAYQGIIDATTTVEQLNTYTDTSSIDFSTLDTLGYTLLGTFGDRGIANVGLLESGLSKEGYPVYKQEVVTYVANLLKHSLEIPERTTDGWKNYRYVKGTKSSIYGGTDLATALRAKINKNMGTYAQAAGKDLVGTWSQVSGNITSYYDAAYFLLNSIFVEGSYNNPDAAYDYLVLSAGTDSTTGDKVYVFDGGFVNTASPSATTGAAIKYDSAKSSIQNTSAAGKAHFVYEGSSTTTLNPFLPLGDRNGTTLSPYYQDDGVVNGVLKKEAKDTLYKRNFGFAMASEGEFVYRADDELFFEFEGDDDVYLFINGELVMDIGSAHSIDTVRFNLNDYVNAAKAGTLGSATRNKALALEEGGTYGFKFYYMERHSYGSNIRISTNIRVTDPSMVTEKTAWQDGTALDFGSIVDKGEVVEYGFAITNNGDERLHNLTFTDASIGVTLDPTNGLKVNGERVFDVNDGSLEASDLSAVITHDDYSDINVTFDSNEALKEFLKNLTAEGTEQGGGLYQGATVQIRGIGYKLSDTEIGAGVFDNTVLSTATNPTGAKTLQGQATMRVFVPADPMYYEWAGHDLSITKAKLVNDVLAAAKQEGNILAGKTTNLEDDGANVNKVEIATKAGNVISSEYVTVDGSNNLKINYPTAGSKVFYAKITYNNSKNTVNVPVLVNVTDVNDSVYVLDYGLDAELTDANELFKNDAIVVPGRATNNGILALGSNGAYASNEITFTSDDDGVIDGSNGTYTLSGQAGKQKLTFDIGDGFMEAVDTFQFAMNVYEKEISPSNISGTLNINKEVEMYKNVKVLPATVVYYEDNFPAITYKTTQGEQANSFVVAGTQQSVDQTQEYGQDEVYQNNSDMSGNSITTIKLNSYQVEASFTFKGTGFELVGRTNAVDSGTLIVNVKDSTGKTVKNIPVITEFDNNNDGGAEVIYQVPVIKVKDLDLATYTVSISGVPSNVYDENGNKTGTKDTYLYVDGLRIYQPLGETNENYNATENGAKFVEIRNEILTGKAAVSEWTGEDLTVASGLRTWTENYDGNSGSSEFVANEVNSAEDYLLTGPNNEVYMMGDYIDSALLLYVTEDQNADMTGRERNLQIGVHAVDEGLFVGATETGMNTTIKYGINKGTAEAPVYEWVTLDTVESATEQYYTIDYTKCPLVDGRYQVVVLVDNGMVSFTNLKMNGLELDTMSETSATALRFENGFIMGTTAEGQEVEVSPADVPAFMSLRSMMMRLNADDTTTPGAGDDTTTPDGGDDTTEPGDGDDTTEPGDGENGNAGESGDAGNSGTGDDAGNTGDSSTGSNAGSTGNTGSASTGDNSSKEEVKTTVDTGDHANILLMVVLMIVSLAVAGAVLVVRRRNR